MSLFHTLDDASLSGKRVLVRVDLNVPMEEGRVTDATRIDRILPTIREIADKGGKVILLAHFGRPKGVDPKESLKPVAAELAKRGEGAASFAAPAAAVLDAMRPVPGVKLRDLGYAADGTLRFTAAAPRAEDVNAVLIALQNNGWKVTVPPALAPDPTGATVAAITVRAP